MNSGMEGPRPTLGQEMGRLFHGSMDGLKKLAESREARIGAGLLVVAAALYMNRDKLRPQLTKIKEDLNLKDAKAVAAEAIDVVKEKLVEEATGFKKFVLEGAEMIGGSTLDAFIGQFATHSDEWEERLKGLRGGDLTDALKDLVHGFMHSEQTQNAQQAPRRPQARRVTILDEDGHPFNH